MSKIDYKNWQYGDTFYLEVPKDYNTSYSYILIYNVSKDNTKKKKVYIKLTNDLPTTINEEYLNNCEFLCTSLTWYENRFWPLTYGESVDETIKRKSQIAYYPDEYGILHTYITRIFFNNKNNSLLKSLVYLGNFNLELPLDEFIPWHEDMFPTISLNISDFSHNIDVNTLVQFVTEEYHKNNLKQSIMFDKEFSTKSRKEAKEAFEHSYVIKEKEKKLIAELEKNKTIERHDDIKGLTFLIENKSDDFFDKLLKNIPNKDYKWNIIEEEINLTNILSDYPHKLAQFLKGNLYNNKYFIENVLKKGSAIFCKMQMFKNNTLIEDIKTVDHFYMDGCDLIVLITENKYVEVYTKIDDYLQILKENLLEMKITQWEYKNINEKLSECTD